MEGSLRYKFINSQVRVHRRRRWEMLTEQVVKLQKPLESPVEH